VSRQLVGDPAFGAGGYRYCGSILGAPGDGQFAQEDRLVDAAASLARVIAAEFDLVGVNGIDFITRDGVPYAVEVNPRWSSSMELAELAYRVSILGMHAAACRNGTLPHFDLAAARHSAAAIGKAVVFARQDVTVRNTGNWRTAEDDVRDIPHAGDHILAGAPVCTVFATGRDSAACYEALVARANRLYAQLEM
jgi:predicted ATP-grasp superfamily ATP-dependent carboligase